MIVFISVIQCYLAHVSKLLIEPDTYKHVKLWVKIIILKIFYGSRIPLSCSKDLITGAHTPKEVKLTLILLHGR